MPRKQVDPERRAEIGRQRRAKTRARILAAAFEVFGDEEGLFARIEDIADRADVTRATFYNHFASMSELRDALTHEVAHDFLSAVIASISEMADARYRITAAVRYYLHRAREDRRWGWSMMNISATGYIFGRETYERAERTVARGIDEGVFPIPSAEMGRDVMLGASLAAMGSLVRRDMPEDYPEVVAGYILHSLRVEYELARRIAHLPLPALRKSAQGMQKKFAAGN